MLDERRSLLAPLGELARRAGAAILSVYHGREPLQLQQKADDSPLTRADGLAHEVLAEGLARLTPGVTLLSEEGALPDGDPSNLWLVDPLDGTREFLAANGQFGVNIALLEAGRPVLGLIYLPVTAELYLGIPGDGAWLEHRGERLTLPARPLPAQAPTRVTVSRSQGEASLAQCRDALHTHCPAYRVLPLGSALKFCELAAGRADLYPRYTPTHAWDTAAGQALLEGAGGAVLDCAGRALRYGSAERWCNGPFLAIADGQRDWSFLFATV